MTMIGELGLRYRPAASADLEAHAAAIALLANDLADIPIGSLEKAIRHHVDHSAFMPKASDLIGLAQNFARGRGASTGGYETAQECCDRHNAELAQKGSVTRWIVDNGRPSPVSVGEYERARFAA